MIFLIGKRKFIAKFQNLDSFFTLGGKIGNSLILNQRILEAVVVKTPKKNVGSP